MKTTSKKLKMTSMVIIMAAFASMFGISLFAGPNSEEPTVTVVEATTQQSANTQGKSLANAWGTDSGYTAKSCIIGNTLYYSVSNELFTRNLKTGEKSKLASFDCFCIMDIKYHDSRLYFVIDMFDGTGGTYPHIVTTKVDGTDMKEIAVGDNITFVGDTIYYVKQSAEDAGEESYPILGIYSMNLDGKNDQKVVEGGTIYFALCDGQNIYYTNAKGTYRTTLTGKNKKKIISGTVYGKYRNDFYYGRTNTKTQEDSLYKINVKTGKKTKVAANIVDSAVRVDEVNKKLYYATYGKKGTKATIYQKNLKNNKIKKIGVQSNLFVINAFKDNILITYSGTDELANTNTAIINLSTLKKTKLAKYFCS